MVLTYMCMCRIPSSGKLSREKTFANFAVLWLYAKVFSAKFGAWHPLAWQKWAIHESFLCEIIFFTNSRKFSPSKVSCYTVLSWRFFYQSFQLWPLFEGSDYVKVVSIWKNIVLKWESCTMFKLDNVHICSNYRHSSAFMRLYAVTYYRHKKSIKAQFCFLLIFCTRGLSTSSHSVYLMSCHSLFPQSSKATNLAEHVPSWRGMAPTAVLLRNAIKSVVCVQTSVPLRNAF